MGRSTGEEEDVHQHSGWLVPLAFGCAILLLSGLFLGWYLRPGPRTPTAPTAQSGIVHLTVRGIAFAIPANYIESAKARTGGELQSLSLAAIFPTMQGWSEGEARLFAGNAPDSPVIRLSLRGDTSNLDPQARLSRIYQPYIAGKPVTGPFALIQYGFAKNSGYERSDLFAVDSDGSLMLFLCEKPAPDNASPNCIAVDRTLAKGLSYSWRFKRAYLSRWREMSSGVNGLIARFRKV